MTEQKTCIYCGHPFTPPKPTTPMCEHCWYAGRHHAAERAQLLDGLRAVEAVDTAGVHHTGGGCFGLGITLKDKRYLFATDAHKDAQTGEWFGEASLPEPGEPWALGIYLSDEVEFMDGEMAEPMRLPLTNDELIAAVREIAAKPIPPTVRVRNAGGDTKRVLASDFVVGSEMHRILIANGWEPVEDEHS
jgi:hypothetical protein